MKRTRKVEEISQSILINLFELASLAGDGVDGAAAQLHQAAVAATTWLTSLCASRPGSFVPLARVEFDWPVLHEPSRDGERRTLASLTRLELGKETGINIRSGKSFSRKAPANEVVCHLYELAKVLRRAPVRGGTIYHKVALAMCVGWPSFPPRALDENVKDRENALEAWGRTGVGSKLPALSKGTAAKWADATGELVKLVYGENFEDHEKLRRLKQSVLMRARGASKKTAGRGVVRAEMIKALKQAWKSIAAVA